MIVIIMLNNLVRGESIVCDLKVSHLSKPNTLNFVINLTQCQLLHIDTSLSPASILPWLVNGRLTLNKGCITLSLEF